MESDNTIRTFTVVDIEKYHRGQLSAKEMHELEKAALDDPFLADALEGYAVTGIDASADIAELKKRLSERREKDKVIPLGAPRSSFPWLRAAAMIVLVAGAGLLVYKFGFSDKSQQIAQAPKEYNTTNKDTASVSPDSISNLAGTTRLTSVVPETSQTKIYSWKNQDSIALKNGRANATSQALEEFDKADNLSATVDTVKFLNSNDFATSKKQAANQGAPAPVIIEKDKEEIAAKRVADDELRRKQFFARENKANKADNNYKTLNDSVVVPGNGYTTQVKIGPQKIVAANNADGITSNGDLKMNNQYRANVFRGQVIDGNNNPLPFANITNTADNIGTYSDVRGNFTLTSPDSVLNVQIRSLGFDNNNTQLKPQVPGNRVIMQEDRNGLAEVVVSNKKVNSTRARNSTMVLEEPEPIDGWVNYDTYIANNLNVPETFKSRQSDGGEVQLSFEVNDKGEPVNITVDKSLCESCDKEAIRLVKQGPKWKRKSRKGRTSVTISF